jgi:hypothetical protein
MRERAESIFKRIETRGSLYASAYATWLQEEGRFPESVQVLERSILREPTQGAAYHALADAGCFTVGGESLIDRVAPLLKEPNLADEQRMHLFYALGRAQDQAGQYREAMSSYDGANELAFRTYPICRNFDAKGTWEELRLKSDLYSKPLVRRFSDMGLPDETPIFIVGMIRSGTTLMDQIVSSHPDVASAGELTYWGSQAGVVLRPQRDADFDPKRLRPLAAGHLAILKDAGGDSSHVTDKMPLNFMQLGLIHLALPKARILHIRRNPIDTCLSIYMTFLHGGSNFAYKKENIATFYRAYLNYMAHWRAVLPKGCLYEVDYEALVQDPEGEIRAVLEFLGLPWNDACVSHESNKNSVTTPSRWQVRQPTYTTSVHKWRRYEPWLGSFRELVGIEHP